MKKTCLFLTLLGVGWLMMPTDAEARVLPTTAPLRVAEQAQAGIYISFGGGGYCPPPRRVYCPPPRRVYYNNYNYGQRVYVQPRRVWRRGCY